MKTEIDAFELSSRISKHTHFRLIVDEPYLPLKIYATLDRIAIEWRAKPYVCFGLSGNDIQITFRHIKTISYEFDGWVTRYYITALDYKYKKPEEITCIVECM